MQLQLYDDWKFIPEAREDLYLDNLLAMPLPLTIKIEVVSSTKLPSSGLRLH